MPKILSAKDYRYRKVVTVVMNPDESESVHLDGSPHTGSPSVGTPPGLRPWEWCHDCRYNCRVQEIVWTGDQLYTQTKTGSRRSKTDAELLAELESQLQPVPVASDISGLLDVELNQ